MMAQSVAYEVLPLIDNRTIGDGLTQDAGIREIGGVIRNIASRFISGLFGKQIDRLAESTISRAAAETDRDFVESVNHAVGVDMSAIINRSGIQNELDAAVMENVGLIRSLSEDYFGDIERLVMEAVRTGQTSTQLRKNIVERTGASESRAKLIARDQLAKVNSDISRKRAQQIGATRFKWMTAQDQRVSGNPAGRYPNASIKCYEIAKQDIGMGAGVYSLNDGARYNGESGLFPGRAHINCRCVQRVLIPGVDYDDE
ncbi:phage minor head protein [Carnimonas bestiolae]|uniref:phage minor head protein n=1 Tax=Carnimonas bestiolae TaxID=3402172 RepID=UPI003EDBD40E